MVSRGLIIKRPEKVNNGIKFLIWIMYLINRYHLPYLIINIILFSLIALINKNFSFLIAGFFLFETFYLSIAFHEACHMAFAKFINIKTESVSFIPYSLEIRTNFSREKKICPENLFTILFAGPIIPILLGTFIILLTLLFKLNMVVLVFCCVFMLINLLSLLPIKGSDGQRVYAYLKKCPSFTKTLLSSIIYFLISKIGLANLIKM